MKRAADGPLLCAEGISFAHRPDRPLFQGVDFTLTRGEIVTVLGPNGAGKTTLLECLAGIRRPGDGRIAVCGEALARMDERTRAQRIGYVAQMSENAADFSVRDYVAMGRAPYLGLLASPGKSDYARVDDILAEWDIAHLADARCSEISGGERQQARIAQIVVQAPQIVLLDEPTNHLDCGNQIKVLRLIRRLARQGAGVVMTTHMPDHAMLLNGHVAIMDGEGGIAAGSVENIVNDGVLRRMYDADLHLVRMDALCRTACVVGSLD